jgi:hypothetical protein
MRTTLTLDEDVAGKIRQEMRRTGQTFRDVVNTAVRIGLLRPRPQKTQGKFVVRARSLDARPGLNYSNISDLIEQIEGPRHQ